MQDTSASEIIVSQPIATALESSVHASFDTQVDEEEYGFRRPPTFFESVLSGSAAAITETLSLHWTTAERFREQVGAPKTSSIRVLYKSLMPDIVSMIPITVCQVFTDATLRRWIGGEDRTLSTMERIMAAMLAGMAVSPLASYAEMLMLLQQKYSLGMRAAALYLWHLRRFEGFVRGLITTGIRDSFYCGAYLGVAPAIKDAAEEHFENYPLLAAHNHWLPFVLAGPTGGLLAAVITQPIDCIKSCQQSVLKRVTISEAAQIIFAKDGFGGFFKGIRGRAKRVSIGVVIMSLINDKVQNWLIDHSNF